MKRLLINLDRSKDRLDHCREQFARHEISFERIDAVDGQMIDANVSERLKVVTQWPQITISELACFMSHRRCWQNLVDSTEDFACIFEDDVFLSDEAKSFVMDSDWIPPGIELLKLETFQSKTYFDRWWRSNVLGRSLWKTLSFQPGTAAYIISKELAAKLLSETENNMFAPVDHYLFDPACITPIKKVAYQLVPAICAQQATLYPDQLSLGSNIEVRSVQEMFRSKRGTLSVWKKIKRETKRGFYKFKDLFLKKRKIIYFE